MEAKILCHENADPAFDMVGGRHRWLGLNRPGFPGDSNS